VEGAGGVVRESAHLICSRVVGVTDGLALSLSRLALQLIPAYQPVML